MTIAPGSKELSAPSATANGKILAVDYGRARIGLAIAESLNGIPQPFGTLHRVNRNEDMRRLRELARDNSVRLVLVGLPLRLDGEQGDMADETQRFARRLRKQIGVAVEMVDERLTSWKPNAYWKNSTAANRNRVRRI